MTNHLLRLSVTLRIKKDKLVIMACKERTLASHTIQQIHINEE